MRGDKEVVTTLRLLLRSETALRFGNDTTGNDTTGNDAFFKAPATREAVGFVGSRIGNLSIWELGIWERKLENN
ncbi:hypothetical protein Ddye_014255 [Dipteronia dyeriana]|uniref:Uncharacterized protein n=1 Tax=Dipteronia dyeriana TaxID=168575 RepID=A0AAE0CKF1_9ROSI|nr:hypothetical protein Ddye_014255 [Dipteronia dyeriana]